MARKKFKLTKVNKQGIVAIGFGLIGLYMMFILNDIRGIIPFILGIGVLLWWCE